MLSDVWGSLPFSCPPWTPKGVEMTARTVIGSSKQLAPPVGRKRNSSFEGVINFSLNLITENLDCYRLMSVSPQSLMLT